MGACGTRRLLATICLLALVCLAAAQPIILSSSDIADNYDEIPRDLIGRKTWLGLYVTRGESRVEAARVEVVAGRIVTNPPSAQMLFSEVPAVSAGAAVTVGGNVDLGPPEREAEFRLGKHVYRVRLESAQADLCDAVITLSDGSRSQKLFEPRPSALACDEPHFRIHWAGDLDRDGRLDLLVTFSRKYSYFPRQLLLSSGAGPSHLVSEVGRYERFSQ
jgi:hypothetical protein